MKLAINHGFGGFHLCDSIRKTLGWDEFEEQDEEMRSDPQMIALVEDYLAKGLEVSGHCSHVALVEIPDESTDYRIEEYDGAERVIYVLNGKIHCAV